MSSTFTWRTPVSTTVDVSVFRPSALFLNLSTSMVENFVNLYWRHNAPRNKATNKSCQFFKSIVSTCKRKLLSIKHKLTMEYQNIGSMRNVHNFLEICGNLNLCSVNLTPLFKHKTLHVLHVVNRINPILSKNPHPISQLIMNNYTWWDKQSNGFQSLESNDVTTLH